MRTGYGNQFSSRTQVRKHRRAVENWYSKLESELVFRVRLPQCTGNHHGVWGSKILFVVTNRDHCAKRNQSLNVIAVSNIAARNGMTHAQQQASKA
jgi:hypothetical protein